MKHKQIILTDRKNLKNLVITQSKEEKEKGIQWGWWVPNNRLNIYKNHSETIAIFKIKTK